MTMEHEVPFEINEEIELREQVPGGGNLFNETLFYLDKQKKNGDRDIISLSGGELHKLAEWVIGTPATQPQVSNDALIDFLQVNFTLHKRRLGLKSAQGHYLTNLAAMNAFHDVLEYLKNTPKLPS